MSDALLDAAARGDLAAFDRAAQILGGGRGVLEALIGTDPETVRALEARLPARSPGPMWFPRIGVSELVLQGPAGFWAATAWILRVVPHQERSAPSPAHEQWDALLEIHRARPEAPWLAVELVAALAAEQRPLGRRALLGLDRRFADRGRRIALARAGLGDVPLADLLEAAANR